MSAPPESSCSGFACPKRATRLDGLSASLVAWRPPAAGRAFAAPGVGALPLVSMSLAAMDGVSEVADLLWASPLSVNVFFDFQPSLAY
jgi:hypothetical protein